MKLYLVGRLCCGGYLPFHMENLKQGKPTSHTPIWINPQLQNRVGNKDNRNYIVEASRGGVHQLTWARFQIS